MKLLIIGGTRFLGRALVDTAVARGHTVTLFNRGKSNPDLYDDVETIVGDRDGGLDGLKGRTWDAVIDTCGYVPRLVRDAAELLKDAVDHYTFISSISVYADFNTVGMDESAPLATLADESVEEITGETYGGLKVLCENVADEVMNGHTLHVRSGFIVGPNDFTDRFSYYPHRIAEGGEVLLPQGPDWPIQFIDASDIARWVVLATEQKLTGPYNITGPATKLTFGELAQTCKDVSDSDATFTYASEAFLRENEVEGAFPLWAGSGMPGIHTVNCQKAIDAGLTFRPLADTIRDTLDYLNSLPADHEWRVGLGPERERELLEKLRG
jgi:2'-hydroxyisoflavone reductase